jgi:hypothetical protein
MSLVVGSHADAAARLTRASGADPADAMPEAEADGMQQIGGAHDVADGGR